MLEPDCFLCYRISAGTRNFTSGKSDVYVLASAATRGFKMVLRLTAAAIRGFTMVSFTEAVSRRNTFLGGTCAPASALLVFFGLFFYPVLVFKVLRLSLKPG